MQSIKLSGLGVYKVFFPIKKIFELVVSQTFLFFIEHQRVVIFFFSAAIFAKVCVV